MQFIWWTRNVECKPDILHWFNNALLLYDSVIRDKRSFLTGNGLLLQEETWAEGVEERIRRNIEFERVRMQAELV